MRNSQCWLKKSNSKWNFTTKNKKYGGYMSENHLQLKSVIYNVFCYTCYININNIFLWH